MKWNLVRRYHSSTAGRPSQSQPCLETLDHHCCVEDLCAYASFLRVDPNGKVSQGKWHCTGTIALSHLRTKINRHTPVFGNESLKAVIGCPWTTAASPALRTPPTCGQSAKSWHVIWSPKHELKGSRILVSTHQHRCRRRPGNEERSCNAAAHRLSRCGEERNPGPEHVDTGSVGVEDRIVYGHVGESLDREMSRPIQSARTAVYE